MNQERSSFAGDRRRQKQCSKHRGIPQSGQPVEVPPERVLHSPGFSVAYPEIRDPELIDPGFRAAMEVLRPISVFEPMSTAA